MAAVATLLPVFFMIILGMVSRGTGWISPEQKAGANAVVFGILFPILIFNLICTATLNLADLSTIAYLFACYLVILFAIGPLTSRFTSPRFAHISKYLLVSHEGGSVALPLFLSIVGTSSITVIFDMAGLSIAFIVAPIVVAREAAAGNANGKEILKNIFSNSFVIAVILGLVFNLTGLYQWIVASPFGPAWTATLDEATGPIVGMILFILGFDLAIDRETLAPILKLLTMRLACSAAIVGGFFLLFPELMADPLWLIAVLIYFSAPTGFGMAPVIEPLYKDEKDASFVSAFMSLYLLVSLVVYTIVVLFVA